jgi:hypothetical protein
MLTLYFVFVAARQPLGPAALTIGYGLPLLLGKVSFLPGGLGLVETTMTALYSSLGVSPDITVVVTIVYRLYSFWLPTLVGLPMIPLLNHLTRDDELEHDTPS